jgi:threonylcarbamoyladenosine tRNA methylthiotransferase MtaB
MRISVVTQGCKVNQSESGALEEILEARGHELVPFGEVADAVVVNTCTVTHRSDRDARALIRRAKRSNPGARVIVTGCYAQINPETLSALGADAVVGTGAKQDIPDLIEGGNQGIFVEVPPRSPLLPLGLRKLRGRSRAFFKVQEGCEAFCSYCIVPYARGPSRSLPLNSVCSGLAELREGGNGEVVLTGVHLGFWGRDLDPPRTFSELLDAAEKSGIPRIRLSSLEPREVTPEVVERLASSPVLCPHLHVPLQSGSDHILRAMGRPYSSAEFREAVLTAHGGVPGICLGFDVIVGFPGEDDAAFRETLGLLEGMPFAYLHVFPFSARRGTRAWDLPERVPETVVKERAAALRALSRRRWRAFQELHLGKSLAALPEGSAVEGRLKLTTRSYISVVVPWSGPVPPREQKVEITRVDSQGVFGRTVSASGSGG